MAFHTLPEGFPNILITAGMKIELEAVDPVSETPVSGVTSSRWMIYGEDESVGALEDVIPDYSLDSDEDDALGLHHA